MRSSLFLDTEMKLNQSANEIAAQIQPIIAAYDINHDAKQALAAIKHPHAGYPNLGLALLHNPRVSSEKKRNYLELIKQIIDHGENPAEVLDLLKQEKNDSFHNISSIISYQDTSLLKVYWFIILKLAYSEEVTSNDLMPILVGSHLTDVTQQASWSNALIACATSNTRDNLFIYLQLINTLLNNGKLSAEEVHSMLKKPNGSIYNIRDYLFGDFKYLYANSTEYCSTVFEYLHLIHSIKLINNHLKVKMLLPSAEHKALSVAEASELLSQFSVIPSTQAIELCNQSLSARTVFNYVLFGQGNRSTEDNQEIRNMLLAVYREAKTKRAHEIQKERARVASIENAINLIQTRGHVGKVDYWHTLYAMETLSEKLKNTEMTPSLVNELGLLLQSIAVISNKVSIQTFIRVLNKMLEKEILTIEQATEILTITNDDKTSTYSLLNSRGYVYLLSPLPDKVFVHIVPPPAYEESLSSAQVKAPSTEELFRRATNSLLYEDDHEVKWADYRRSVGKNLARAHFRAK